MNIILSERIQTQNNLYCFNLCKLKQNKTILYRDVWLGGETQKQVLTIRGRIVVPMIDGEAGWKEGKRHEEGFWAKRWQCSVSRSEWELRRYLP